MFFNIVRFGIGRFVSLGVLQHWAFCGVGPIVFGRFVIGRFVFGRFVFGRFVFGCIGIGRFVFGFFVIGRFVLQIRELPRLQDVIGEHCPEFRVL